MYVRPQYVRSGYHAISVSISPICSPSVSISCTAARKWPLSVSAQRPYGSPSCGGSAAKLITKRSVGGISLMGSVPAQGCEGGGGWGAPRPPARRLGSPRPKFSAPHLPLKGCAVFGPPRDQYP